VVTDEKAESGIYSNVPYPRVEYVANRITAYFNLDLALIRGYRLGDDAVNLLTALALLKVRRFLDGSLRLRTACDFQVDSLVAKTPPGFELPVEAELLSAVQSGIKSCASMFADPPVTRFKTKVKIVEKEKADKTAAVKP
jgi:CRISPR-associated protein Csb1